MVSDAGAGWSGNEIIRGLDTRLSMVYRVRKQLVEETSQWRKLATAIGRVLGPEEG